MKKLIYIIGILMFLSGPLHPWTGLAANEESPQDQSCNVLKDPSCRLTDRIEYALRGKGNKGLDWGDSFGATDPKDVGQNLYLMIYKKAQSNPMNDAIKATAEQYGLPPERMSLILSGDITPIMERAPMMRVEDAIGIYDSMIATYNDRKNSSDLAATINTKIEPSEMFADGDLSNSGFDLIKDLDNIEIILFKKADLVSFGGAYNPSEDEGTGTAQSGVQSGGGSGDMPVDLSGGTGSGTTSGSGPSGGTGKKQGSAPAGKPGSKVENPFQAAAEDKSGVFAGGINPNQCFASQNIDQALNKFAEEASKNPQLQSTYKNKSGDSAGGSGAGKNPGASGSGGNDSSGGGTGGQGGTAAGDTNIPVPTAGMPAAAEVTPATPDDYSTPPLCDDIICVTLEFIQKPATASFTKTDNCIQCHVQFINESLQKTISHSLIPAKASGNLGESGLCKNAAGTALGSVGMNVSLNVVTIVTPVKDDLITLGNITDEWDKYASKSGAWTYNEQKRKQEQAKITGKPEDKTPPIAEIDRMLEIAIINAPDGASQASVAQQASNAYAVQKTAEAQEMLVAEIAKSSYAEVDTMKALDDEMKAMNNFFDGFRKQFLTLLTDVPGLVSSKACVKLREKQACS
jgi:hypothetical protein